MINSFYGLEMARRATNAFRLGLETAGHNVSNVKTEGYSRQRVNLATTLPYTDPSIMSPVLPGQIGTGVQAVSITRIRDEFLDFQYREAMNPLGYWSKIKDAYNTISSFIALSPDPSTVSTEISSTLDALWANLQELSKSPESAPIREAVVQQAKTFGTFLDQFVTNLDKYAEQVNSEVKSGVDEVNDMLTKLGQLNKSIAGAEAAGMNPNDLYDTRDLLLDKLSGKLNISIKEPTTVNDEFIIDLNGKNLVQGDRVRHLVAHAFQWDGNTYYSVQVEDNEFDIVDNCAVADVLPGGPEGAHQLNVSRLASESSWKVGGGDAFCLDDNGNIVRKAAVPPETVGEPVYMRVRPNSATDALNVTGSFRLQVGSSGVKVSTNNLVDTMPGRAGMTNGQVLGAGTEGEAYTFRVSAGGFERNITASWNNVSSSWVLSDDVGRTMTPPLAANAPLTVENISNFLRSSLVKSPADSGNETFTVDTSKTSDTVTQFGIKSNENWLISIVDVRGNLAEQLGLSNSAQAGAAPIITIDVGPEDSLQTICNKINEKYSLSEELDEAKEWLHASVAMDAQETAYLVIESNVIGEGNMINIMGDEDSNMQVLRRLGLVQTEIYDNSDPANPRYREVTNVIEQAEDASFTFDGRQYLSETNMLKDARKIPSGTDYSATVLEEVSTGLRLNLKGVGSTGILVLNHVKEGELRALQDVRDNIIPAFMDSFDDMVYTLVNEFNAVHYSGYGIGDAVNVTGTAFFDSVGGKYGATKDFSVSSIIENNINLIAAAMGNGSGKTSGVGDGANALLLAQLKHAKLLNNSSADFNSFYEAFISQIGTQAAEAESMYSNQDYLAQAINNERLSVMGVNVDEEMLDIMQFSQAFNAMARYVNTIDEMLDRIINGFGLVGR